MKNDNSYPLGQSTVPLQPILEEGRPNPIQIKTNLIDLSELDDEKENKKEEPIMKDLIAENFIILTSIGKGAFGEIFLSFDLRENLEVAIKQEKKQINKVCQLKIEAKVYQKLLNIQLGQDISGLKVLNQESVLGVPKFYGMGELIDNYYLIMEFLGPNLHNLFNYCRMKKFTISTVCLIALQMLNRIEYIHKHHFVHRDIKPENFCIGTEEKTNVIYLIDYGLSKRYKNSKNHQHIPYREGGALVGTARYVSINTHLGIEQSRRDDIESIGYVLIYFLKGNLPWQGLKAGDQKYNRIMEKKLQIPTEVLCYGLPDEIVHYLNYTKNLRFEERPDYDYLRNLFVKLLGTCASLYNLTREFLRFDWCFDDPINTIWQKYAIKKNRVSMLSNNNNNLNVNNEEKINISNVEENKKNDNKGGIIEALLESSKSDDSRSNKDILKNINLNLGEKNDEDYLHDSSSLANEKDNRKKSKNNIIIVKSDNDDDNESDQGTLKFDFNGVGSDDENYYKYYNKKEEKIDGVLKKIIGEENYNMYDNEDDEVEEMLRKNKTEVMKNTMRNSKNLTEIQSVKDNIQKKFQNMNKKDLMKLDGINGLKKVYDENISNQSINDNEIDSRSSENKNSKSSIDRKRENSIKTAGEININNKININETVISNNTFSNRNLSGFAKKNTNNSSIANNNNNMKISIPQKTRNSLYNTQSVDKNILNKLLNHQQNSNQNHTNQINQSIKKNYPKQSTNSLLTNHLSQSNQQNIENTKHSFESEIIPKMTNAEITNRKSKILEVSSIKQMQMKVGKENLIKISTESINNNYVIVGELGSGSYGTVKKVKHKKLGEYRAMKIISKKSESSQNEVEILRKISHPNIVNIFEIYEDSKKYYIMMEICEGGELFEAISTQGSFSEADCANIMKSLLAAVNYLHGKNIVHRDLKPENIMLTKNLSTMKNKKYEIKLIDFGTAKQFEPHQKLNKFIGTSYYIAPEVLKENYDEKCDIWSCGVILYILLCGYPPFNGNSNVDIYHNIQNNPPYFNGEEWKDVTKEAIDLIKCMLNKIPSKRFSAEQCLNHKWFKLLTLKEKGDEKSIEKLGKKLQLRVINKMADFVKENRLKQAVLQFISTQFHLKKEEDDLKALFSEFDIKQKGQISKEVFYEKLSQLYGENDGREICDRIFERLDLDGSGEISYDEFLSAMIDGKKVITDDRLAKAFKMFDKDGNGKLSIDEIIEVFGGEESYWKKVIEDVDLNHDGEVDYEEFKLMMGNLNGDMVKK